MTTAAPAYVPSRASGPSPYAYPDRACRPLRPFSGPLSVLLIIYAILSLLVMGLAAIGLIEPRLFDENSGYAPDPETEPLLTLATIVFFFAAIAERIVFFICVFFVCRFTFRAMKNLYTVRSVAPDMSPTMSVVWYFIPFAFWFMPVMGMSQIHKGSVEENGAMNRSALVSYWWAAWLIGYLASTVANISFTPPAVWAPAMMVAQFFFTLAALLLRTLVLKITRLQDVLMNSGAAETFR